jgi:flagellum-specific peptidoglycan hydrolase FlgJ
VSVALPPIDETSFEQHQDEQFTQRSTADLAAIEATHAAQQQAEAAAEASFQQRAQAQVAGIGEQQARLQQDRDEDRAFTQRARAQVDAITAAGPLAPSLETATRLGQATGDGRAGFFARMRPIAEASSQRTGIPADVYLAIAANESNFGNAPGNALFGVKGRGVVSPTWEAGPSGQRVGQTAEFQGYSSPEESFADFDRLVTSGRYAPAYRRFRETGDVDQYLSGLQQAGYATDPTWAGSIRRVADTTVRQYAQPGTSYTAQQGPSFDQSADSSFLGPGPIPGQEPGQYARARTPEVGIERTAIRQRAESYLGTPYLWGGADKQGIDCSAFISRAWGVGRQTTDTLDRVAEPIPKEELTPGDALNLTTGADPRGYGHVRMFDGWADPEHRTMYVYESSTATGGVARRVIPYDGAYTPMRLRGLGAADPTAYQVAMHTRAPPPVAEQAAPGRPTTVPIVPEGDRPPSEFEPSSAFPASPFERRVPEVTGPVTVAGATTPTPPTPPTVEPPEEPWTPPRQVELEDVGFPGELRPEYERVSAGRPGPMDVLAATDVPNRVGFALAHAALTGQDPAEAILETAREGGRAPTGEDILAAAGVPESEARRIAGRAVDFAADYRNVIPGLVGGGRISAGRQLVAEPLGAAVGGEAGGEIGERLGGPTGRVAGELAGGLLGAGAAGARYQAAAGRPGAQRLGIVPPGYARYQPGGVRVPQDPALRQAVANTPGAEITPEGLRIDVQRFQKPEDVGRAPSGGGVFYAPRGQGVAYRFTADPSEPYAYGGPQEIAGPTLLRRPFVEMGANERATLERLAVEAGRSPDEAAELVGDFTALGRGPSHAAVLDALSRGRTMDEATGGLSEAAYNALAGRYGLPEMPPGQGIPELRVYEALRAGLARQAGYDSVVRVQQLRNWARGEERLQPPTIAEVHDLRESAYPTPEGGFTVRPEFEMPPMTGAADRLGVTPGEGGLLDAQGRPIRPPKGDVAPILDELGDVLKEVRVRAPRGEITRPEFLQPEAKMPTQAVPLLRQVFDRTRNVIGSMGEAGQDLAGRVHAWREGAETDAAAYLQRMPGVDKLGKTDFENMVDVLEQNAKPKSIQVEQAAAEAKSVLDDLFTRAENAGVDVAERIGNYFPHQYKQSIVDRLRDTGKRAEAIRHLMTTGQADTEAEAIDKLSRFATASRSRRHGSLEMERLANLPGYEKTKEALYSHVLSASRRVNEVAQFGRDDAIKDRLITRMTAEGYDGQLANDFFKTIVGAKTYSQAAEDISRVARTWHTATRLGLSAISNATQSVNTASVAGVLRTLQAMPRAAWSPAEKEFAASTGVTLDSIIREVREGSGWSDRIPGLFLPGFNQVERFNRRVAAIAGRDFARDMAEKAAAGSNSAGRALKTLGLDVDDVVKRGGALTPEEEIAAARNVVERTQFRVDPQDLPQWTAHPIGKMVSQFKTFAYNQSAFVQRELIDEARRGNVLPILRFAILAPLAQAAATETRNVLSGRPSEEDPEMRALQYALGPLGLVGDVSRTLFGINSKYVPIERRTAQFTGSLLGPTVGTLTEGLGAGLNVLEGNLTPAARLALRQVPLAGGFLANTLTPYKSQEPVLPAAPSRSRDGSRTTRERSRSGGR